MTQPDASYHTTIYTDWSTDEWQAGGTFLLVVETGRLQLYISFVVEETVVLIEGRNETEGGRVGMSVRQYSRLYRSSPTNIACPRARKEVRL